MSFRSIQSESSVDDDDDEKEYFGSKGDQEAFKEMIHQHTLIEENHDDVFDSPSQIRESTREDIIPAISVLDADIERVKGVLMTNTIKMCSRVEAPMRLKEVHVEYACRIEDGISDTTTLEWIRNNISQRVCCLPVRTYRDKDNNDVCFCYKKCVDHHDVIGDTKSLVWTKDNNTTTVATDAFGDVRVHADDNSFEGKLKYVRVDEEMTMTLLQQLLFDKWRLNKPDWILTVMGEVSANSKGQKQFWTLLADTIGRLSTKKELWLVSEGICYGLGKLVGKSVRRCTEKDCRLTHIGIFGWGYLKDADKLIQTGDFPKVQHLTVPVNGKGDFMSDSINYSLLVDNGTLHPHLCSSSYMTFTVDAISAISNHQQEMSSVPSVILLYGGWSAVLDGLKRALALEIPVIVMKNSGGFADIFATGFENCFSSVTHFDCNGSANPVVDDRMRKNLRDQIYKIHGQDFKEGLHLILQCFKKPHLFTICDLKAKEDFFTVIVQALFKTRKTLELGRVFDNFFHHPISEPDYLVASGGIKEMNDQISTTNMESLHIIMLEGILMDKAESVEFILNSAEMDLTEGFCTDETVKTIYNRAVKELPKKLGNDIQTAGVDVFAAVDKFVDSWIPNYCRLADANRQNLGDHDRFVKYVFIWAVLSNRREIARLFWKKGKDLILTALVANTMLSQIAENQNSINMCNIWKEHADIFLNRAIGTLNDCYKDNRDSSLDLMVQKWHRNQWNVDFINVCLLEFNRKITIAKGFRHFNRAQWRGRIRFSTGILKIVLASIFYPLLCCIYIIKFRDVKKPLIELHVQHPENEPEVKPSTSGCHKLCEFRAIPIVKFIHYMIWYVAFLCLYGHYLLFEMVPQFSVIDILLSVWVFSFLVEEIVQIIQYAPGKRDTSWFIVSYQAFRNYWESDWNKMDVIIHTGFITGMILRAISCSNCYEAGRLFLCVVYLFFVWRGVQSFSAHKHMGPMILMIRKMLSDLVPFLIIFFVAVVSFAVTQEALLYPNSFWSGDFLYKLPHKAFWQIFGEYFLDEIGGENECSNNATMIRNGAQRCPTTAGRYLVPVLLSGYILMTNVLLLNIIIAQFSYRFETIQNKADQVWAWQSCCLTLEFQKKPTVSPPLTLLWRVYWLTKIGCCYICHRFCRKPKLAENTPLVRAEMPGQGQAENAPVARPTDSQFDSEDDNGLYSEDETDMRRNTETFTIMDLDEFEQRMGYVYLAELSVNSK